ncbi:MAG TPA: rhodanese-like domain-containing protein [Gammaproteobacteria bacterium]|nr:rhodanese-like domain-containing protein [Gammaproteobacteria bacterium]
MTMQTLNIAGYKFIELNDLTSLRNSLQDKCSSLQLKGTILLSPEGINISLAGTKQAVMSFKTSLAGDERFADMRFHHTYSSYLPFKHLKVKLKNEIITLRQGDVAPVNVNRAPDISPSELKRWLDEKRDITLLDTRNDYEYRFGTFAGALNLHIHNFGELPEAVRNLDKQKPLVMFCTGGIRCEKAAIYMMNQGFSEVYQLDGGILGYFAQAGGAHYEGECFVFDERIALDSYLKYNGTSQCTQCQGPISANDAGCTSCAA